MALSLVVSVRFVISGREALGNLPIAREAIRQPAREGTGLLRVGRLEIGGGDLHPEVALAVLALAEVADQREKRRDLSAGEREMNSVDVLAAPLSAARAARPSL